MTVVYRLNKWAIACIALCVSACYSQTKGKMEECILLTTHEKSIGIGRLQVSLNSDIPLYHAETGRLVDAIRFSIIDKGEYIGKFNTSSKYAFAPMKYYTGDSEMEAAGNIINRLSSSG